jgi:peroxiredoxin
MKKALSIIVVFFSLLFVSNSYSQSGLNLNDTAPNFSGIDQNGKSIVLNELLKNETVVLIFYRGEWCPYCNKQLSDLQDSISFITQSGAKLIAITPENKENIKKTLQKTDVSFSIISDDNTKIMTDYKVAFELDSITNMKYKTYGINLKKNNGSNGSNLPVPAVYVINKKGEISFRYFDSNYKKRLSVKELLKHL